MDSKNKLRCGIGLLVLGLLMPLGIYPVLHSDWPAIVKTTVSGALTFGFEIMAIPAVAIMGKENFERIMTRLKGWVGNLKPSGNVGKLRYNIGLAMFVLSIVPTYMMAYAPQWLPDYSSEKFWVNIAADLMFLVSLFVLGGDFWDKLRALFVRDSRVVFPEKKS